MWKSVMWQSEIVSHPNPHSTKIVNCGGEHFPRSYMLTIYKDHFSTIFHKNLNMHFEHNFDIELEFTSFYLSPDTFSYVVYTNFLHAD